MNRIEFVFDKALHYALYELMHLDGVAEYYLELRDRPLIDEFGEEIRFRRDADGHVIFPPGTDSRRKETLVQTILQSIDLKAASPGRKD